MLLVAGSPDLARSAPCGPSDDLWLISTREAPSDCPQAASGECLRLWRWDSEGNRVAASRGELLGHVRRGAPLAVYLHGNNNDADDAVEGGLAIYRRLRRAAPDGPSMTFVIWSWPSDRYPGSLAHNLRLKAHRCETQAFYLAGLLAQLPADARVVLSGHSYGARVITASLHLLAGGSLQGYALPGPSACPRAAVRAVLTAAAVDTHWLAPGQKHGAATAAAERLAVVRNAADPVLKRYPLLEGLGGPSALGFTGPPRGSMRGVCGCVEEVDVTEEVGKAHLSDRYFRSPTVLAQHWRYLAGP